MTVASMAGSWIVMSPSNLSFSSMSTTTAENVWPIRSWRSSASQRSTTAFSYWLARRPELVIVSGSSAIAATTQSGTSVPAHRATQISPA